MHLDQMIARLKSQSGLVHRLGESATLETIQAAEARLDVEFPEQIRNFWQAFNGIGIDDPPFIILPLAELKRDHNLVPFCICNRNVQIAFDVSHQNQAGQWSIVNTKTNYCITLTMASFWSTHMWTWISKRRPIWYDVHAQ